MTNLCLIRHGETDYNKNFMIQGITDNPLNSTGRNQAKITGEFLKEYPIHFDVIISSPMKRAQETASIISNIIQYKRDILISENLYERNFGSLEGTKITSSVYNYFNYESIIGLEHDEQLETRVMNELHQIVRKYNNKNVLIVAHSHVIKSILVQFVSDFTYRSSLLNSSLNFIEYHSGTFHVKDYNVNKY